MGNYQNTRHHKGPRELTTGGEWIYGRNPVIEALRAGRRTFTEIILPPGSKDESDEIASLRLTACTLYFVRCCNCKRSVCPYNRQIRPA